MAKFRSRVGAARISGSMDPSAASYTRSIRDQMRSIERSFDQFCKGIEQAGPEAIKAALMPTYKKAIRYCPKDTGDLVNSAYLEAYSSVNGVKVEIGFARGGTPNYAVYVHEMLSYSHKSPTRAKFLQAALEEDSALIPKRLLTAYRQAVNMGR